LRTKSSREIQLSLTVFSIHRDAEAWAFNVFSLSVGPCQLQVGEFWFSLGASAHDPYVITKVTLTFCRLCLLRQMRTFLSKAAWTSMSADVAMPFGAEVELRRARRYPLSTAVTFCWDPGDGILQEGHGTTLDISSSGVFVITDLVPRAGGRLELEIYLSPAGGQSKFVRFHGEGKVVRTNKTGAKSGFAAEVLFQAEASDSSL
jgi:hypothetical protein